MLKGRFERLLVKGVLWATIGLAVIFSVFMVGAVWEVRGKERLAFQEKNHARATLEEVQQRYETLTREVKNFESDRGLEEELRNRFPIAKEGEEVIVLVDAPPSSTEATPPPRTGVWATVLGWFGL
ncbi:MAG: hypothetical protein AAB439_02410 [Patescibacteria group bacterium]|mgnify:CR=1 FL=1